MAVGSYFREDVLQTLAEKWNGKRWSISASKDILDVTDPVTQWLTGISCASTNFCMAVGISELSTEHAFGEIWNGSTWKLSPLPATLKYPTLNAVSCPSTTSCVAVGYQEPVSVNVALIMDWSGTTWSADTASNQGTMNNDLTAVQCSSTTFCMAVGYYEAATTVVTSEPLAEYGSPPMLAAWTLANPTVNIPGADNSLLGVSCTSSSSCMAVGDSDIDSQERNLSFAWNGSAWTRHPVPEPGIGCRSSRRREVPRAAGKIPAGCVAAGAESSDPSSSEETAIFGWNGSKWAKQASPSAQPFQVLEGLSCPTLKSCVAVGEESDTRNQVALADSFIGTSWIRESAEDPVALTQFLYGTSCVTSSFCMAVGQFDNGSDDPSLAQIWNGAKWATTSPQQLGRQSSLHGVSCASKSFCVGAGEAQFGQVLIVSPSAPAGSSPRTAGQRIAKDGESAIPVTGELGLVEVWRAGKWSATTVGFDSGSGEFLNSVSCPSTKFCMAVGGTAFEDELESYAWNGKTWAEESMPSLSSNGEVSNSVSCTSATNCVAVGGAADARVAFAQHWNGKRWSVTNVARAPDPFDTLNAVDCPSAKRCIAVGGDWSNEDNPIPQLNLAESWNGSRWSVMTVPTSIYSVGGLAAVSCNSNVSCLAAGPGDTQLSKGGIVLRLANHHWTSVGLPVAASAEVDLQGVSETSASSAVVVGLIRDLYGFSTFRLVESKGHWAVK